MRKLVVILLLAFSEGPFAMEVCPKYYPKWQGEDPQMEISTEKTNGVIEIEVTVPGSHEGLPLSAMNATICLGDAGCAKVPLRFFEQEEHVWSSLRIESKQKGRASVLASYSVSICGPSIVETIDF